MDWEKLFSVSNHSGMGVFHGSLDIPDGTDSLIIDPNSRGEHTVEAIKSYVKRGILKVTNDFVVPNLVGANKDIVVAKVQSADGGDGDKHNHYVFDPFAQESNTKSFSVQEIDMGKGVTEEQIDTTGKGIVVNPPSPTPPSERMTNEEAIELLGLQWKKFESEVNKITDVRKLNFLQVVATQNGASDKKQQVIADRLSQL
jgi:hypothetical protein